MTSVVAALDSEEENYVTGENGREQYDWSKNIKEQIIQLNFQLVRNNSSAGDMYEKIYTSILNLDTYYSNEQENLIKLMHKMVAFTRDLKQGKGEYMIAYNLLYRLSKHNTYNAMKLMEFFVHDISYYDDSVKKTEQGYGSWKDLKYMWANFPWNETMRIYMIRSINAQIFQDSNSLTNILKGLTPEDNKISLLAKWVPRENSKYKSLFYSLAENYYSGYIESAKNNWNLISAKKKAYMNYRKLIACINKYLDTTQIKQCADRYDTIEYKNVTSITMMKQKKAFLNIELKTGNIRSNKVNRIQGSIHFNRYLDDIKNNNKTINGKRVGIVDFVKNALKLKTLGNDEEYILNSQWNNLLTTLGKINNFVAMCDTSSSMQGDPLMASIGLGIAIAEQSVLGKRVLTFNSTPEWINLEDTDTFTKMVKKIATCPWGGGTNFTSALKLICRRCVEKNLTNQQVTDLVLVVLSDMQIDYVANETINQPMWENIKSIYASYGYKNIPTILFWNLRHTEGFPVKSHEKGAIMFSGYSPSLLNTFCEKGMESIQSADSWNILQEQLNAPRYSIIDDLPTFTNTTPFVGSWDN